MKEPFKETKKPVGNRDYLIRISKGLLLFMLGLGVAQIPGLPLPSLAIAQDKPHLDPLKPGRADRDILLALERKRERIELKDEALTRRESYISEAEERLQKQIEELAGLRSEISTLLNDKNVYQEKKFKDLAKIHAEMPISKSAAILTKMPDDIAVKVILNLKRDRLAKVLAKMDSERAYSLNRELLGLKPEGKKKK